MWVMARAARAMAMEMRVRGEQMAAALTVAVMRVASNKEGEGGKAMETVTRLVGKQQQWRQRRQW